MAYTNQDLANLIFSDVTETIEDLEKRYPKRNLPEGAEVTRFAPSPTGFLHTGSLFTAMIAYTVAKRTNGIYFFRLEDTDQKREVAGTGDQLVEQLAFFGIKQDEGYMGSNILEKGDYGSYVQSKRESIYNIVIKHLISIGRAYPCFCTKEELDELRKVQEANKVLPGYYGNYARCRHLSISEQIKQIKAGKPYVIRFRSNGDVNKTFIVNDLIRGNLVLPQNNQDIVIRKSDGLPTYHFAHLCDDHFMRTTVVTRGEEWLSSLPIHIELFESMDWKPVKYAHLPVIMVVDNETGNRRKLSKRKDKEAAVGYFIEQGYPKDGIIKYLMTISNSNFEEWLKAHPLDNVLEFPWNFNKMSRDGALFDLPKLSDISQNVLAYMTGEQISEAAYDWAKQYSPELKEFIEADKNRFVQIMNIERNQTKPRKDYVKFSDIYSKICFFDNKVYDSLPRPLDFDPKISKEDIKNILEEFSKNPGVDVEEQDWFPLVKACGEKFNFASNFKDYKNNPEMYKGFAGDVASIIRVAITGSRNSPSLYCIIKILGLEETRRRLLKAKEEL